MSTQITIDFCDSITCDDLNLQDLGLGCLTGAGLFPLCIIARFAVAYATGTLLNSSLVIEFIGTHWFSAVMLASKKIHAKYLLG